jgi:signal transduction histidine kinase
MPMQHPRGDELLSVASLPATPRQRRVAAAFSVAIVGLAAGIGVIGVVPLPRTDGFVPTVQAIVAAAELATALLLFSQYVAERSRAVLLLAGGYLFTALIVVAQTLTFPGAYSATGLLGAGPQTAAWLYVVWHLGLPATACAYALLKPRQAVAAPGQLPPASAVRRAVVLAVTAAFAATGVLLVAGEALPPLVVSATAFSPAASIATSLPFLLSVLALAVLWRRRTSVLDEWLVVAIVATVAETAIVVFVGASRYTFTFYAGRLLALLASCAVLVALLSEMAGLYLQLSTAVNALRRERANKLMNLEVVMSSIAHEIKQPLMVITTCSTIIASLLRKPSIDAAEVQLNVDDMTKSAVRIGETIDSLRGLFKDPQEAHERVDVNALALETLETLRPELAGHDIAVETELAPDLPAVVGHRGQLREVFLNIVQNAVDELAEAVDRPRTLRIRTQHTTLGRIFITIEDSGSGIAPERLPTLFTAFITTKARGMGLGLSLCQMIVDRHNGELSVSSELGKGTRFDVSLPAEAPPFESTRVTDQRRSLKSMP